MNWSGGILRVEEEDLRNHAAGNVTIDGRVQADNTILQKTRIYIIGTLTRSLNQIKLE